MSKFKYTGTMRGVTPMGKAPLQNLPHRTADTSKLTKMAAQTVLGDDWMDKYLSLAETELRIIATYHDEIVSEVKK